MDFAFTDEQLELRKQARAWLPGRSPLHRGWEAPQDDRWSESAELGGLDVAEAELGFVEEAILLEELGYALYPGPYLGTIWSLPSLSAEDRAAAASGAVR